MELKEVKVYKERLEKELNDLLSYRKEILAQVEIDERLKKGITPAAKEIFELKKRIKEFELKSDFPEIINQEKIKEMVRYKIHTTVKLEELLSFLNSTTVQLELEKKELETIKKQKDSVLEDLWKQDSILKKEMENENKKIGDLKKEQSGFIESLAQKEKALSEQEKDLISKQEELREKLAISAKVRERYDSDWREVVARQIELQNDKEYVGLRKTELENKEKNLAGKISVIDSINEDIKKKLDFVRRKQEKLVIQEKLLSQREEAVGKSIQAIIPIRKKLKENEKVIESRKAEVRKKEIESKGLALKAENIKKDLGRLNLEKEAILKDLELKKYKTTQEYQGLAVQSHKIEIEISEGEKAVSQLENDKKSILDSIAIEKNKLSNEIDSLKQEKRIFIETLENRQKEITEKENKLLEDEKKLSAELTQCQKSQEEYKLLSDNLISEQDKLSNANLLTEHKKQELDNKIKVLSVKIEKVGQSEAVLNHKISQLDSQKAELSRENQILSLEKEAVEKTKEQIEEEKKRIEKNRQHLYSQQSQLSAAFREAKDKKII